MQLPEDKTVYYERGLVYQMMGNHKLAIGDFLIAIAIDNKYAEALFCLGTSRLKCKEIEEAKNDFNRSLEYSSE